MMQKKLSAPSMQKKLSAPRSREALALGGQHGER
jgi:hypothetical protein